VVKNQYEAVTDIYHIDIENKIFRCFQATIQAEVKGKANKVTSEYFSDLKKVFFESKVEIEHIKYYFVILEENLLAWKNSKKIQQFGTGLISVSINRQHERFEIDYKNSKESKDFLTDKDVARQIKEDRFKCFAELFNEYKNDGVLSKIQVSEMEKFISDYEIKLTQDVKSKLKSKVKNKNPSKQLSEPNVVLGDKQNRSFDVLDEEFVENLNEQKRQKNELSHSGNRSFASPVSDNNINNIDNISQFELNSDSKSNQNVTSFSNQLKIEEKIEILRSQSKGSKSKEKIKNEASNIKSSDAKARPISTRPSKSSANNNQTNSNSKND
jgi:hypothetical protein